MVQRTNTQAPQRSDGQTTLIVTVILRFAFLAAQIATGDQTACVAFISRQQMHGSRRKRGIGKIAEQTIDAELKEPQVLVDGVTLASVDLDGKKGTWEVDETKVTPEMIIDEIVKLGYKATVA